MSHSHSHSHGHGGHSHSHGHSHAPPKDFTKAFAIGIVLNMAFVIGELAAGFWCHSLSLLADAGHNFSDVAGLALAWGAAVLSRRKPTPQRTYGLQSSSILAALTNAVLLLCSVAAIAWEAVGRFHAPVAVGGEVVAGVAAAGIVVNGLTAALFVSGRDSDLNVKGAFLHMLADAIVSAGVVVAGILIQYTGLAWIDPVTSLVIAAIITYGTWGLLRDALHLTLQGVPAAVDWETVMRFLSQLPGVEQVHDLHIWALSTTEIALTVHLVKPDARLEDRFVGEVARQLKERFAIGHTTIQLELSCEASEEGCAQNCV